MKKFIFVINKEIKYSKFPFNPDYIYPEFECLFKDVDKTNRIYRHIRDIFIKAGYDKKNIGTKYWNPFNNLVKDGDTVVIKPNLVFEEKGKLRGKNCITTNANIIRPVIDYLYLLEKNNKIAINIIIADTPLQSANFEKIVTQTKIKDLVKYYYKEFNFKIRLIDLRKEITITNSKGFIIKKIPNNGDPLGYKEIHLEKSFLDKIIKYHKRFSIGDYNTKDTKNKHNLLSKHYYLISNTILLSNLFINIPKIKTHKKAGITIALKNLIGISGNKSWIPHYRRGSPRFGGDEFTDDKYAIKYIDSIIRRFLQEKSEFLWDISKYIYKKTIKRILLERKLSKEKNNNLYPKNTYDRITKGSWYGNDTLWRSILDLNYLLFYTDKNGKIQDNPQRKYMCIGDGVISAEGNGPINPKPKNIGLISFSNNPIIHDICCARLMGFEWRNIPQLKNSTKLDNFFGFEGNIENIYIKGSCEHEGFRKYKISNLPNLNFLPPSGWRGHMEIKD